MMMDDDMENGGLGPYQDRPRTFPNMRSKPYVPKYNSNNIAKAMGTVISKAASGIGSVLGTAFVAPFKSIFNGSCEDVCPGPWDIICFIEHLCVTNLSLRQPAPSRKAQDKTSVISFKRRRVKKTKEFKAASFNESEKSSKNFEKAAAKMNRM
ncbi:hypothetical protein WN944_022894 [Citrus x changshan-huyou]|uniref:Uncharacterized protein n=1 Tax=Citrus x changshan-huyou TaxID=2935761 RepID=A0AAP0N1I2_9ROSI